MVELRILVPKTPEFCKVIGVEELLIVMSVFVTPNVTPEPAFRPLVLKFGLADVDPNKDSPPIFTDDKFIALDSIPTMVVVIPTRPMVIEDVLVPPIVIGVLLIESIEPAYKLFFIITLSGIE